MPTTVYTPGSVEPGWTTTEFYQTLVTHVVAAVIALMTIFRPGFALDSIEAIIPAIAIVASTVAQFVYTASRSKVKIAAGLSVAAAEDLGSVAGGQAVEAANFTGPRRSG